MSRVMRKIPNWISDPISVITAPVSATLVTRVPHFGDLKMMKPKSAAERLRQAERSRQYRKMKRESVG